MLMLMFHLGLLIYRVFTFWDRHRLITVLLIAGYSATVAVACVFLVPTVKQFRGQGFQCVNITFFQLCALLESASFFELGNIMTCKLGANPKAGAGIWAALV